MRRDWTDPRDGLEWTVEALPFDLGPAPVEGSAMLTGWTLVFVSHSHHRVLPVGYPVGVALETMAEPVLIALLDAAGGPG